MIRLARFARTRQHTHTHSQLSNQSSGLPRTTVLTGKERRSSLNGLVIPAWLWAGGGDITHTHTHTRTHTHTHVSEQGRCHHNGLMSEELQGESSGAGYTSRSVRAGQGGREMERTRREGGINCIHGPWVIQTPLLHCVTHTFDHTSTKLS